VKSKGKGGTRGSNKRDTEGPRLRKTICSIHATRKEKGGSASENSRKARKKSPKPERARPWLKERVLMKKERTVPSVFMDIGWARGGKGKEEDRRQCMIVMMGCLYFWKESQEKPDGGKGKKRFTKGRQEKIARNIRYPRG